MTHLSVGHRGTSNPFSTRFVRPGRVSPLDAAGRPLDMAALGAALAGLGGSAAIEGPHGSGKTTLLVTLAAWLEQQGVAIERVSIRGPRDLPRLIHAVVRCSGGGVVCVDGGERIGRVAAAAVRAAARLVGSRLLVTAHRTGPLPTLAVCRTSPALLGAIVAVLPGRGMDEVIGPRDIDEAFHQAAGDVREALFVLYDRFEQRTRNSRQAHGSAAQPVRS